MCVAEKITQSQSYRTKSKKKINKNSLYLKHAKSASSDDILFIMQINLFIAHSIEKIVLHKKTCIINVKKLNSYRNEGLRTRKASTAISNAKKCKYLKYKTYTYKLL